MSILQLVILNTKLPTKFIMTIFGKYVVIIGSFKLF